MAWRKVDLDKDKNLRCDISDASIYAAVHDLKNQLRDAGVIAVKKSKKSAINQPGDVGSPGQTPQEGGNWSTEPSMA